jgi:Ca2+-binding RTX toxin-like protein
VWNAGFAANSYAQSQANSLWGNGTTVSHGANIYYGYRSAQIADIAHKVFTGTHADQVVEVLAGQAANSGLLTYMLQGVTKAGVGAASTLFDQYAVAPYFGGEMGTSVKAADEITVLNWAKSGAAGMDAAFKELEFGGLLTGDQSLAVNAQWLMQSGNAARAAGLDLATYEGGISVSTTRWDTADKATVQDFFNRLLDDPRMGDLYTKLIAAFKAAGGTEFLAFNDAASPSDSGSWGMLNSIYDDGSERYDALLAQSLKYNLLMNSTSSSDTSGGTATGTDTGTGTATASVAAEIPSPLHNGTSGDDIITGTAVSETIDGAAGNDVITGSSSSTDASGNLIESDLYMGGAGSDTITGGIGNDHIYGNATTTSAGSVDGADSLSGAAGNDYIQGNAGADTIDGGTGNDKLYGGADGDSILGGAGNDYLQGNKGNDVLSGGDGGDILHGGADNDSLNGDAGNDQIFGEAGNDTIRGGAGIDTMSGATGNDVFVISGHDAAFATTGSAAWQVDHITDFADGADTIMFDFHPVAVLQGSASTAAAALTYATQQLQAHAGEADVAAVTVGNDTYMFWDSTGHGGAIDSAMMLDRVKATIFTTADFA